MSLIMKFCLICIGCFLGVFPLSGSAEETSLNAVDKVCSYTIDEKVITQFSIITFIVSPTSGGARWICMDGKLILEAPRDLGFKTYGFEKELLENGTLVKHLGRPITRRMVVTADIGSNKFYSLFWLLDFRNKQRLLVGPMVTPNLGRNFSVIWHEDNVIVIFDDDGGPQGRRYHEPDWGKDERHFVDGIEAEAEDVIYETGHGVMKMVNRPLMNKDGVFHPGKRNYINMPHNRLVKNGKLIPSTFRKNTVKLKNAINVYPGYYYDYKTNKLTEIAIEED